jgi:hypothetical protein
MRGYAVLIRRHGEQQRSIAITQPIDGEESSEHEHHDHREHHETTAPRLLRRSNWVWAVGTEFRHWQLGWNACNRGYNGRRRRKRNRVSLVIGDFAFKPRQMLTHQRTLMLQFGQPGGSHTARSRTTRFGGKEKAPSAMSRTALDERNGGAT